MNNNLNEPIRILSDSRGLASCGRCSVRVGGGPSIVWENNEDANPMGMSPYYRPLTAPPLGLPVCTNLIERNYPMKKKNGLAIAVTLGITFLASVEAISAATILEWSDIAPQRGRYSNLYADYVAGTFYVMNDWIANQDGMRANEYNRFNFTIGTTPYEIKIYPDHGEFSGGTLINFKSATGWGKSPPDFDGALHMQWEFQFDVAPLTLLSFSACDPISTPTIVLVPPPLVDISTGPSIFTHTTDGVFTEPGVLATPPPVLSDGPARDPVPDPWFPGSGFVTSLNPEGGVTSVVPEPGVLALLGLGGVGLMLSRRRKS